MFNSQLPSISDLPTSRQLIGSTLVAIAGAAVILVTVVLPSEYGIDPTGAGRAFGLTEMGEIKVQLAQEAASDRVSEPSEASDNAVSSGVPTVDRGTTPAKADAQSPNTAVRSDQTEVVLKPGQGAEVKVAAAKGARIEFDWSVRGGIVNYDTHADAPGIDYHGYGKGKQSGGETGTLVAAFDGKHGWFWRNRTEKVVTIILKTSGAYTSVKRVV
ncbi:MAG: transmembrane anchor protein [Sphingobium sp.]|jgi:hypothetical protein|nr:transmembrane anchor protein [Sphingobium sp.]MCI1270267.1 transmembrane anchor protein [Sphingobium sp.]MCI2051973.1 transmembrane anchor protein [Sphingobium sp.]